MLVSYIVHPYRPMFRIDSNKGKELFAFGKWVWSASILAFLLFEGDDVVVGKVFGTRALGLYQMAYRLSNLPATEFTRTISQVALPIYAKLQKELPKLRKIYLKVLQVTSLFAFLIGGILLSFGFDLTTIFLGTQWQEMVPVMQILAIYGIIRSIDASSVPLFQAVGMPKFVTILQFLRLVLTIILLLPSILLFDFFGVGLAITGAALCSKFLTDFYVSRIIQCEYRQLVKILLPPLLAMVFMYSIVALLESFISCEGSLLSLAFVLPLSVFVFIGSIFIFSWAFGNNLLENVKEVFSYYKRRS
jgi:O-antigen/teichoic acid export membrane protein